MSNHNDLPLTPKNDAHDMTQNTDTNQNDTAENVEDKQEMREIGDSLTAVQTHDGSDADEHGNSIALENNAAIDGFFAPSNNNGVADNFKAGYVAIVGRPNVGKSTLMNHLLGQKLSITSRKPQTTRHRIHGILSTNEMQAVFVDTPGIHHNEVRAINERMNKAAVSALVDVDLVLFVVDSDQWREDDLLTLQKLGETNLTVVLVINKADTLKDKGTLLPLIETFNESFDFADIVPVSALKNQNLNRLEEVIASHLPNATPIYDTEQITDRSERFLASEIIREKIIRSAGDEVPYDLTVQIDEFKDEAAHTDPKTGRPRKACTFIDATIYVERNGQKAIVIGEKGQRIKQVGIDARKDMEQLFGKKVMLTLWVKVKRGWSDDERALTSLGY